MLSGDIKYAGESLKIRQSCRLRHGTGWMTWTDAIARAQQRGFLCRQRQYGPVSLGRRLTPLDSFGGPLHLG